MSYHEVTGGLVITGRAHCVFFYYICVCVSAWVGGWVWVYVWVWVWYMYMYVCIYVCVYMYVYNDNLFFYLGFLSRTFTIHRTAGEGVGYFFNSSLRFYHFHPLHRHLDISRAITAESSPLHLSSSWTRTENLWIPSAIDISNNDNENNNDNNNIDGNHSKSGDNYCY